METQLTPAQLNELTNHFSTVLAAAFKASARDWSAFLQFIKELIPLILQIIQLFNPPTTLKIEG